MHKLFSCTFILLLIFSFTTITLSACSETHTFSNDTKTIDTMIEEDISEIDYSNYVSIEMEPSEIVFNKTTEAQIEDNELCNIIYYMKIENISSENIKANLKMLIPDELTSSIIYGETSIGPRPKNIELKPGEKIDIAHGTLMKHTNKLNKSEKEIFEKHKYTLYIDLLINGKKAYVKQVL